MLSPPADGPKWLVDGHRNVWLPYAQMQTTPPPLPVTSTQGSHIQLADGRVLIDGIASWWTAVHGYRHPDIVEAVSRQLQRVPHVMLGGLAQEPAYRLASRLAAKLPGTLDHVFFSESGSVSVEVAMKMAVQYWRQQGECRDRFLGFYGGYHGDTFATMTVCDPEEGMHALFGSAFRPQHMAPLPVDADTAEAFTGLIECHAHELAAVLVEPFVQGAGGMRFHDADTLARIRQACDRHGVLLIFDEIFVGFGRTGRTLFACEAAGVAPDIITVSKALTGGLLPLAATVASSRVFDAFMTEEEDDALMHGPTFMGNALACAAANASLDLFEQEPRLEQARRIEARLIEALMPLTELPGVREARALGAIGVVELEALRDAQWWQSQFLEAGVWLRPFGNVLYTTPALNIDAADLERVLEAMVKVTRAWSARYYKAFRGEHRRSGLGG